MPEHEDVEQLELPTTTNVPYSWYTFCSCGLAFGGGTSQAAYDRWAQHEADES
jgi:hypothetical protein